MADQPEQDDLQNDEVIGQALRWSLLAIGSLVLIGACVYGISMLTTGKSDVEVETEVVLPQDRQVVVELPMIPFEDQTVASGVDWTHVSGMEGEKLLPETMGGGVAIFDFDRDGDNDILFVGGKSWDWAKQPNPNPRSVCLYSNDGSGKFSDVTKEAGLEKQVYGMAPCIGDYDNDGWSDLFLTGVGGNSLFHNEEGRFIEVTDTSGVAGSKQAWTTGAAWFDFDRDGLLDLWVSEYVVWNRELDLSLGFSLTGVGRAFGQPTAFTGTNSRLYRNQGNGKFVDVSEEMGIKVMNPSTNDQVPVGKGLAVATVDVDQDGWLDVVVANDTVQNFLFLNIEGKYFEESAILSGIAFDRGGVATGAMGIDCSYLRNDKSLAIAIGNFANEPSSLYVTRGAKPPFFDEALPTGIGPESRRNLTFGMLFVDLDLDSRSDVVCTNGHLEEEISKVQASQQYEQPPQFFWNAGRGTSSELVALSADQVGAAALKPMVGRGAASGDLDGDGDLDLVLVANSGSPRVLLNEQQIDHNWLRLELVGNGVTSNRDAIGAVVEVVSGDLNARQFVTSSRSYLSQCEKVLTFGLGARSKVDSVKVTWPDATSETFAAEVNSTMTIQQSQSQ